MKKAKFLEGVGQAAEQVRTLMATELAPENFTQAWATDPNAFADCESFVRDGINRCLAALAEEDDLQSRFALIRSMRVYQLALIGLNVTRVRN